MWVSSHCHLSITEDTTRWQLRWCCVQWPWSWPGKTDTSQSPTCSYSLALCPHFHMVSTIFIVNFQHFNTSYFTINKINEFKAIISSYRKQKPLCCVSLHLSLNLFPVTSISALSIKPKKKKNTLKKSQSKEFKAHISSEKSQHIQKKMNKKCLL